MSIFVPIVICVGLHLLSVQRPASFVYFDYCYCSIQSCVRPRIHYAPRQQLQQQQQQSSQDALHGWHLEPELCVVSQVLMEHGQRTDGRTYVRVIDFVD